MFKRHYFIAAKLKGSDVHASAVVMVKSFLSPRVDIVFEHAKRSLAEACELKIEDFVAVAFNRI